MNSCMCDWETYVANHIYQGSKEGYLVRNIQKELQLPASLLEDK